MNEYLFFSCFWNNWKEWNTHKQVEVEISLLLPVKVIDSCGLDLQPDESSLTLKLVVEKLAEPFPSGQTLYLLGWNRSDCMPPTDPGMGVSSAAFLERFHKASQHTYLIWSCMFRQVCGIYLQILLLQWTASFQYASINIFIIVCLSNILYALWWNI